MSDNLYEILVGFQYARIDLTNKYPSLRYHLEQAYGKLYLNHFRFLPEDTQLDTLINSRLPSIKTMSDYTLLTGLANFIYRATVSRVLSPDGTVQATLLKQIQQQFSSIELVNFINNHNPNDRSL